ncbi:hypothetical protein BDV95DRAFT_109528 [Massariosphaeria phaeospora]|uniref:Uncharacterized protein n=1 Tax=Massariosphaeria phaeospora TaxID=100035 RepID=A0A7C8I2B5_9PLEO|nr:hypothetical protein BDV95DRAFT_109528 [Massariosphaeria phaeospora]
MVLSRHARHVTPGYGKSIGRASEEHRVIRRHLWASRTCERKANNGRQAADSMVPTQQQQNREYLASSYPIEPRISLSINRPHISFLQRRQNRRTLKTVSSKRTWILCQSRSWEAGRSGAISVEHHAQHSCFFLCAFQDRTDVTAQRRNSVLASKGECRLLLVVLPGLVRGVVSAWNI